MEKEFLEIIDEIINIEKFKELKNFKHHYNTTRYQHSLNVAYCSFIIAKKFKNKNIREIVKGALLHDFFFYDWRDVSHRNNGLIKGSHAFYHPMESLNNAEKYFNLTEIEKEIILLHMWPFCTYMPKYKESYYIIFSDKYCSIIEGLFKQNAFKYSLC